MPAKFLKSVFRAADISDIKRPQVAMVGRSNVGKSTLINDLTGEKNLAHVGARPGMTQSINVYEIDQKYFLIDLPGYGFSHSRRIEGRGFAGMIGSYLSDATALKLVLLIVDGRQGLTESDENSLEQLREGSIPFVVIFNKVDKLSTSEATMAMRAIETKYPDTKIIAHSAETKKGTGEIRDAIMRAVRA